MVFLVMVDNISLECYQKFNTADIVELKQQVSELINKGLNQTVLDKTDQIMYKYDKSLQLKGFFKKGLEDSWASGYIQLFNKKK